MSPENSWIFFRICDIYIYIYIVFSKWNVYIKTELIFIIGIKSFRIVLLFFVSSCTIFTNYLIFQILIIDSNLEKFFYKLLILKSIIYLQNKIHCDWYIDIGIDIDNRK